jgi:hypothetical protein
MPEAMFMHVALPDFDSSGVSSRLSPIAGVPAYPAVFAHSSDSRIANVVAANLICGQDGDIALLIQV